MKWQKKHQNQKWQSAEITYPGIQNNYNWYAKALMVKVDSMQEQMNRDRNPKKESKISAKDKKHYNKNAFDGLSRWLKKEKVTMK